MEGTVNVQGFEELKRVLSSVPEGQLDMTSWNSCACGHATRDEWFRSQGLTTCTDFPTAAAFFEITRGQAEALFSGRNGRCVTTTQVIENIDQLLARPRSQDDSEVARNATRRLRRRDAAPGVGPCDGLDVCGHIIHLCATACALRGGQGPIYHWSALLARTG